MSNRQVRGASWGKKQLVQEYEYTYGLTLE